MQSMNQAVWDDYFKQFLYYLAGYDSAPIIEMIGMTDLVPALDQSGITFHASDQAGVFTTKAGNHIVSLYDMARHLIKRESGRKTPMNYDFADKLHGARPGIYLPRVAFAGSIKSKRFLIH